GAAIAAAAHPAAFLADLPEPQRTEAAQAATRLLRALQAGRDFKTFGQCSTCRQFQRETRGLRCGLTGERLTRADARLTCRGHGPAASRPRSERGAAPSTSARCAT